ncbi:MAG TPA: TMEM175 family protein [Bdellovibrionota bacterium]
MHKNRVEAFSDGVLAIIITIMVLELKVPHSHELSALFALWPVFLSYVLSFLYIAIYWNNHHHLFQVVQHVNGPVLWANMHLLFWLSLLPFTTGWMGENHFSELPSALYGLNLFMAGAAYYFLSHALMASHGRDSAITKAIGSDFKGKVSVLTYGVAIPLSFWSPLIAFLLYTFVAAIWVVPDQRMEKAYKSR